MALTVQQIADAARYLGRQMFTADVTANLNLDDLTAAVDSIDVAMDTVINTVPGPWQIKTFKEALIDNLPEPFKGGSTAAQKALALTIWAMKEARII